MSLENSEADKVRAELVAQLRESLAKSRAMMVNEKLDAKTREAWTQKHTNTAQVLNTILRDSQLKDWERRLKEMEARRRRLEGSIRQLETAESTVGQETTQLAEPGRDASQEGGS